MSACAGYDLTERAPLDARNTFGVAARAPLLVRVRDGAALAEALASPGLQGAPLLALGGGSNILFAGDPAGPVLALETGRIALAGDGADGDDTAARVRADAGVEWHALVLWTLRHGLHGLENLALIPGTVGAAPIQNIGAYGVELAEFVHAVHAFDRDRGAPVRLDRAACAFAYRDSLFKRQPDRYLVTGVELALPRRPRLRLDYAGLREELAAMGAAAAAPASAEVAEAVIRIRRRKLPDPAVTGNAGSFFKNPLVPAAAAAALRSEFPALPVFAAAPPAATAATAQEVAGAGRDRDRGDPCKLSAAWMIEHCGWKGFREGDAGIAASHALVLVNHGRATGAQLLALARRVADSVERRFGVALEPEPRIIGAAWRT